MRCVGCGASKWKPDGSCSYCGGTCGEPVVDPRVRALMSTRMTSTTVGIGGIRRFPHYRMVGKVLQWVEE